MVKVRIYLTVVVVLFVCQDIARAQSHTFEGMLEQLGDYANHYPQEKVYLHLDKPYYAAGDDIWFKSYVTIGHYHLLSGWSKILYVDLINQNDYIVRSLRLPLIGGVSIGDFHLADSLSEGSYRIRAYTNWMRNFDEDFFYDRTFDVGNALTDHLVVKATFASRAIPGRHEVEADVRLVDAEGEPQHGLDVQYAVRLADRTVERGRATTDGEGAFVVQFSNNQPNRRTAGYIELTIPGEGTSPIRKQVPIAHTGAENAIQFFAEGGSLVSGGMARVAFKATRPNGRSIDVSGVVRNGAGEAVADFTAGHAGMGSMVLHPVAGEQYTAEAVFADGSTLEVSLPSVEDSGYAISVNNDNEHTIYARLYATDDLINGQTIHLLLQHDGHVLYASKAQIDKGELRFAIPRGEMPSGVAQLTVFTDDMVPVLERSLFLFNPAGQLPLAVEPDQASYGLRERVTLDLEAGVPHDTVRVSVLSAAVLNQGHFADSIQGEANILTELLLRSALKGYVESPQYYFDGDIGKGMALARKRALDDLMLTQGWSRIRWKELMAGDTPQPMFQPEEELRVSGVVTRVGRTTPAPNAHVTLFSTAAGGVGIIDTIAGPDGRFDFGQLVFSEGTEFVVQARSEHDRRNVQVILDERPDQLVSRNKNAPDVGVSASQFVDSYLRESKERFETLERFGLRQRTIRIDEVQVRADAQEARRERLKFSANFNGPGQADQVILAEDLMVGCTSLLMCLQGLVTGVAFQDSQAVFNGGSMLILVDGMEMSEGLSMINSQDVESIEVLKDINYRTIYGPRGYYGVLVITTKRGGFGSQAYERFSPDVVTHSPPGYYAVREFYVPDYAVIDSLAEMRDLRTTIHWEPHIVTDEEGKAQISFYTADQPGTYRVVIEGLDVQGRIGRSITTIHINEK